MVLNKLRAKSIYYLSFRNRDKRLKKQLKELKVVPLRRQELGWMRYKGVKNKRRAIISVFLARLDYKLFSFNTLIKNKKGSLCRRKPSVTEVLTQRLYFCLCYRRDSFIQTHSEPYTVPTTFTYMNLPNIQSNAMQNRKSISEEETDSMRICDLPKVKISKRPAQELKDSQIQRQFHCITPHCIEGRQNYFQGHFQLED